MTLVELNQLPVAERRAALITCCGSSAWVTKMVEIFPVDRKEQLLNQAEIIWNSLDESDWREAFTHHPKIGNINSLREKFANTRAWAAGEQSGVSTATQEVLENLAKCNQLYEEKFGYIFIVCATGKSAAEMLAILTNRLPNSPETEIKIAAGEQAKITQIRLEKLLAT
jgi:2-oxo-4-hydroxy-4-carboxy-5-ureidoimidazoline decarboxylase